MHASIFVFLYLSCITEARRVQAKERIKSVQQHHSSKKIAESSDNSHSSAALMQSNSNSFVNPLKFLAVLLATSPGALAQMQPTHNTSGGVVNHVSGRHAGSRSAVLDRRNPGYENALDRLVHGGSNYEVPEWEISTLDTWPPVNNNSENLSLDGSFENDHDDELADDELYGNNSFLDSDLDVLDLGLVLDTLEVDIPQLLHKDPHWGIFTDDFTVYDQNGDAVQGLHTNKDLLKLLRQARKKFKAKDDIQVLRAESDEHGPHLVARWKVQMNQVNSTFLPMWENTIFHSLGRKLFSQDSPIEIEVDTMFHLNENNMIDYMKIDSWLVNGLPWSSFLWPDVMLGDNRNTNLKKIKEWAQIMRNISDDPAYRMDADDIDFHE